MRIFKRTFLFLLSGLLLFFFFRKVEWGSIRAIWSELPLIYPILFALGVFLSYLIRSARWRILLGGERRIPLAVLYRGMVLGFAVTYFLPGRLGEIVRPLFVAQKEKIPAGKAIASVVLERIIDAGFILLLFSLSLLFMPGQDSPYLSRLHTWSRGGLVIILGIVGLIFLISRPPMMKWVERLTGILCRLFPHRMRERAEAELLRFIRSLSPSLSAGQSWQFAGWTILLWGEIILFYWVLSLGFPDLKFHLSGLLVFFAFIFFAAAIPTPGMAGSLDWASRFALTALLAFPDRSAVAYTLLFHFLLLSVTIMLALPVIWREGTGWIDVRKWREMHEVP